MPQSSEAACGTQFPGQCALPTRPVDGFLHATLRLRGIRRRTLLQKFTLYAQQLGNCPSPPGTLRVSNGLVDSRKSFSRFAGKAEGFCELAKRFQVSYVGSQLSKLDYRSAQK